MTECFLYEWKLEVLTLQVFLYKTQQFVHQLTLIYFFCREREQKLSWTIVYMSFAQIVTFNYRRNDLEKVKNALLIFCSHKLL